MSAMCEHLESNMLQPLVCIDGYKCCAQCLAANIADVLETIPPQTITHNVSFSQCGHDPEGFCRCCYIGVAGSLAGIWAQLRLTGESRIANRLARLQKAWSHMHGPSCYVGWRRKRTKKQTQLLKQQ